MMGRLVETKNVMPGADEATLSMTFRNSLGYLMRSFLPGCKVRTPGFSFFRVLTRTP